MKRWLIVGIPLLIFGALLLLRPPAFTSSTPSPVTATSSVKPGVPGGGDEESKPRYGGHEADEYGATKQK